MISIIFGLASVLVTLIYRRHLNPYRGRELYRCIEDGDQSSLYLGTSRFYDWAGGVTFEYFKRVTCVPGVRYTAATSDWFQPWSGYTNKELCHFECVGDDLANRVLAEQLPITRAVKRELAKRRKAGTLKPNEGFGVPGEGCAA